MLGSAWQATLWSVGNGMEGLAVSRQAGDGPGPVRYGEITGIKV